LYGWLDRFLIPVALIGLALALLWLTVAWAKSAMSKATPNVDEMVVPPSNSMPISQPSEAAEILSSIPSSQPRKCRLAWKLTLSFGALALVFTVIASLVAYSRVASVFEKEIKLRAALAAMALSEIAAGHGRSRDEAKLQHAIENHVSNSLIAYIYVEDAERKILAHMPVDLPNFLRRDLRRTAGWDINGVETDYRGLPVFEVMERVGSPARGYVHLAIWHDTIEEEVRRTLLPIVASILVLGCGACAAFAWVVWSLTSPFSELVHYANRISQGELDVDLAINEESDEIRDLARSFARMRSSLYAVLVRLKDAQPANHSNEIS
jgi:HAMP domain-containing protein